MGISDVRLVYIMPHRKKRNDPTVGPIRNSLRHFSTKVSTGSIEDVYPRAIHLERQYIYIYI